MASPRSMTDARRILREADPTSKAGREAIQEALNWLEQQPTVPADVRQLAGEVREAVIRSTANELQQDTLDRLASFWRQPLAQMRWLWAKQAEVGTAVLEVGEAIAESQVRRVEAILRELTDPDFWIDERGRPTMPGPRVAVERALDESQQRRLTAAAWPYLDEQSRAEAVERGVAPAGAHIGPAPEMGPPMHPDHDQMVDQQREQRRAARLRGAPPEVRALADALADLPAFAGDPIAAARDLLASQPTAETLAMMLEGIGVDAIVAGPLAQQFGTPPPIGVPEDHAMHQMPDRTGIPRNVEDFGRPQGPVGLRTPMYRIGDEHKPLGWSVERITDLQRKLVAAGLLQGQFRWGWFDDPTGQAYTAALSAANQRVISVWDALDTLAHQHQAQREETRREALDAFRPEPFLPPDRDAARRLARNSMLAMGRRFADIDDDELEQLVSVYVGEFRRAHQMEQQIARRMHAAEVETAFGEEGTPPVQPDVSGLEERDPIASFEEHFARQFAGEIETRETGQEVARRGRTFDQGMDRMRGQVRGGGA